MSHFREVCEYGRTHSQCRCSSRDKEVRKVVCNMPNSHSPSDSEAKTDPVETIAVRTAWVDEDDCVDGSTGSRLLSGEKQGSVRVLTVLVPRAAVAALFAVAEPVAVEVQS